MSNQASPGVNSLSYLSVCVCVSVWKIFACEVFANSLSFYIKFTSSECAIQGTVNSVCDCDSIHIANMAHTIPIRRSQISERLVRGFSYIHMLCDYRHES